jgi:hypothetical protein
MKNSMKAFAGLYQSNPNQTAKLGNGCQFAIRYKRSISLSFSSFCFQQKVFAEQVKEGLGTCFFTTESSHTYIGEWKNNKRHGYGIQHW